MEPGSMNVFCRMESQSRSLTLKGSLWRREGMGKQARQTEKGTSGGWGSHQSKDLMGRQVS